MKEYEVSIENILVTDVNTPSEAVSQAMARLVLEPVIWFVKVKDLETGEEVTVEYDYTLYPGEYIVKKN